MYRMYSKILKSKEIDFGSDFICFARCSKGERENIDDLPDLACEATFINIKLAKKTSPVRKLESYRAAVSRQQGKKGGFICLFSQLFPELIRRLP